MIFDRFLSDHKISCNNVTCRCLTLIPGGGNENSIIENKIITEKIYDLIVKIQSQSVKNNKSKIIENYFLIELEKKPLKTYFQLIKLIVSTLNSEETLEVENLILETRDNFKQLFLKEKVENNDLQIEPLF